MNQLYDVIIIGAGACGLFTAINIAEKCPNRRILILEKGKEALSEKCVSLAEDVAISPMERPIYASL